MTRCLSDLQKASVALTLPSTSDPITKIFRTSAEVASTAGGERGIVEELREEGDEVLRLLREEQRGVIDTLDLKS